MSAEFSSRVFLLSPARSTGERARLLLRPQASFELAMQLRTPMGAPIGTVFSFLSGLYFRGKLTYANHFASGTSSHRRVYVLTSHRGLLPDDEHITVDDLRAMSTVPIDVNEPRYRDPIQHDLARIIEQTTPPRRSRKSGAPPCEFVLLGSIATRKYVDVLLPALGDRLKFPVDFVGRGDMSRGGLMLRCVRENRELAYVSIAGAIRHGTRPPKLQRG